MKEGFEIQNLQKLYIDELLMLIPIFYLLSLLENSLKKTLLAKIK